MIERQNRREIAFITGGSRGIGSACARHLSKDFDVWITYQNNKDKANDVKKQIEELGGFAHIMHLDYSNPDSIYKGYETFKRYYEERNIVPMLMVLINNVATFGSGYHYLMELEDEEWDDVWRINVQSACDVIKYFSSFMPTGGTIIQISSLITKLGTTGYKSQAHYAVTKSVMEGIFQALQYQCEQKHLRFVKIQPGFMETSMLRDHLKWEYDLYQEEVPLGSFGSPESIGEAVSFIVNSTSRLDSLLIDGGWTQKGWKRV